MTRLNKFITDSGYCFRREADTYISQGRVSVNGCDATIGCKPKNDNLYYNQILNLF